MTVIIAVLIVWNAFLTYKINLVQNPVQATDTPEIKVINNTVNGFSTDLTEVVSKVQSSVVGVRVMHGLQAVTGSGCIWRSENEEVLILTSAALLNQASEIEVIFDNGSKTAAELIGMDELSDVALLRVIPDFNVEAVTVGDSALLKRGEWIIAVGASDGIENSGSVAVGVVSSKQAEYGIDLDADGLKDWQMFLMKTDVSLNPSNTGAPLVNMAGEVVGICSILGKDEENEGFFYVVPSNEFELIAYQLLNNGTVNRPLLGLEVIDIADLSGYQKSFLGIGLDRVEGLYVSGVQENSLLAEAGIQPGDILAAIEDTAVTQMRQYRKVLYSLLPQEEISMTFFRGDREINITVTLP